MGIPSVFPGRCFVQLPIGSGGVGISGERCGLELRWEAWPYPRASELSGGAASVWNLKFKVLVTNESPLSFERPMSSTILPFARSPAFTDPFLRLHEFFETPLT